MDVFNLLLGRSPVSEKVIQRNLNNNRSTSTVVQRVLQSREFKSDKCRVRLQSIPVTEQLVIDAYRIMLGYELKSRARIESIITGTQSQWELVNALADSAQYKEKGIIESFVGTKAFNQIPKTIYLHIPKTAGKAFEQLADRNYGERSALSTTGKYPWDVWQSASLVGGHFFYSRYNEMTTERLFLSIVRDPVERAISRFNYYRHQEAGQERRKSRNFDHDDLKKTIKNSGFRDEFVDNYQCRYLSGATNLRAVKKAFSRDTFIVGHYDEIGRWLETVGQRLGWSELELPKVNVASNPDYMAEYHSDNELIALLKKRNKEDYKLLTFIRKHGVYESAGPGFPYSSFKL
ncbi:MAG: sulfotransferase family 2 domain-containing protein [Halieaceae bacterium]|jgi:hypothetical protein|nr:sulfotransferase family 2 domain-containing protein [Halieaceae bacterium]